MTCERCQRHWLPVDSEYGFVTCNQCRITGMGPQKTPACHVYREGKKWFCEASPWQEKAIREMEDRDEGEP